MARHQRRRHFSFERLEPRILLSADALGGAVGGDFFTEPEAPFQLVPDQPQNLEYLATSLSAQYATPALSETAPAALDLEALGAFLDTDSSLETRHELIFVDAGIEAYEDLLQDLMTDALGKKVVPWIVESFGIESPRIEYFVWRQQKLVFVQYRAGPLFEDIEVVILSVVKIALRPTNGFPVGSDNQVLTGGVEVSFRSIDCHYGVDNILAQRPLGGVSFDCRPYDGGLRFGDELRIGLLQAV